MGNLKENIFKYAVYHITVARRAKVTLTKQESVIGPKIWSSTRYRGAITTPRKLVNNYHLEKL